ncbi:hypothetical protein ONS95_011945 [Cadophora gregata]|uniref:uncharacterized protein n=1 Tax=Cadophora gregata TaxID=51156 RepID=UPI0026DB0E9A|nr:uncharacterized protein ONS95_011945 [Cadophora gregata]KAK0117610.1 hypothetical protein ONS95_011945 [Cadophora gregata]KAK0122661.1 hypothetical protein ONS96_009699 [Cadophora gregata f. sp. sojae]
MVLSHNSHSSLSLSLSASENNTESELVHAGVQESGTTALPTTPRRSTSAHALESIKGSHRYGINSADTDLPHSSHVLRPVPSSNSNPPGLAERLTHCSWTSPFLQYYDDFDVEGPENYKEGGFHGVVLGETFCNGRYTVVHKLGHGGFATVWLVWDDTLREYVALKIVRADQSDKYHELEVLQYLAGLGVNLEENFICPLLNSFSFEGPNGNHLCLVFPLAGRTVDAKLFGTRSNTKEDAIEKARQYGRQLAHAVAFLHSVGIVHADLTQRNVLTQTESLKIDSLDELYELLDKPVRIFPDRWGTGRRFKYLMYPARLRKLPSCDKLLVTDFGQAFSIGHPPTRSLGIPPAFATPEGLYLGAASPGSDIWAIGVLLFKWWCGQSLFRGDYLDEVSWYWTVYAGKLPEEMWSQYTNRYESFDENGKLLEREPEDLGKLMSESWQYIPPCGPEKHIESVQQIDNVGPSCRHSLPEVPFSVTEASGRDRILITLDLPCATRPPNAESPNQLDTSRGGANGSKSEQPTEAALTSFRADSPVTKHQRNLQSLIYCASATSHVELSLPIAEFHCLLKQLCAYEPSARLPAFMLLQHHWFSKSIRKCEDNRVSDDLISHSSASSNAEPETTVDNSLLKKLSSSSSTSTLEVNSQFTPDPTLPSSALFECNNSNVDLAAKNDTPKSILSEIDALKLGNNVFSPSRQSLCFDTKSKTWSYVAVDQE